MNISRHQQPKQATICFFEYFSFFFQFEFKLMASENLITKMLAAQLNVRGFRSMLFDSISFTILFILNFLNAKPIWGNWERAIVQSLTKALRRQFLYYFSIISSWIGAIFLTMTHVAAPSVRNKDDSSMKSWVCSQ